MATSTISAGTAQPPRGTDLPAPTNRQPEGLRPAPPAAESVATGLALIVCVVARLPHRILDVTGIGSWGFALLVAVSVVSVARALARAPFTLPRSLPSGPNTVRALRRWAAAELETVALTTFAGTVVTLPLYALLRATPAWWLPAWLMFAALTIVWQVALPIFMRLRASPSTPTPPSLATGADDRSHSRRRRG